jgi:glycosyltransferase involved in cell wall biosynthesis
VDVAHAVADDQVRPSLQLLQDVRLLSVIIPCLNEAQSIRKCVIAALGAIERSEIAGEVIVADNGSEDGSAELAELAGAHVIREHRRGYGSAYMAGLAAARGRYIVMADADLTYDFDEIPRFLSGVARAAGG